MFWGRCVFIRMFYYANSNGTKDFSACFLYYKLSFSVRPPYLERSFILQNFYSCKETNKPIIGLLYFSTAVAIFYELAISQIDTPAVKHPVRLLSWRQIGSTNFLESYGLKKPQFTLIQKMLGNVAGMDSTKPLGYKSTRSLPQNCL